MTAIPPGNPTASPSVDWGAFARQVRATPAFGRIAFHPKAGKVEGDRQYFFDGSVTAYPWAEDPAMHRLMEETLGAGEPEEIAPFLEAVDRLPPNPVMVELGAGWAMYSLVAGRRRPDARLILVEAHPRLVALTRQNVALNGLAGRAKVEHAAAWMNEGSTLHFREGGYGSFVHPTRGDYEVPSVSVDGLMKRHGLERIDLLHMDVQGAEARVLQGAQAALRAKTIGTLFIGTHRPEWHGECEAMLRAAGYGIGMSLEPGRCASGDGILIAAATEEGTR